MPQPLALVLSAVGANADEVVSGALHAARRRKNVRDIRKATVRQLQREREQTGLHRQCRMHGIPLPAIGVVRGPQCNQAPALVARLPAHVAPPGRVHARLPDQIVANVLNNAAKYTDPGGDIRVSLEEEADAAVLRVRDDGIGIAPEMLSRVFELFARVEQRESNERDGLGIGLALVQRLVQQHGGTIGAASDGPGKGAEFVVRLPKRAPTSDQLLLIRKVPVDKP
jgi:signal transduction histidine kinase